MCGISGFWSINFPQGHDRAREILHTMIAQIHHRGPNEDGIYIDPTTSLGLAHKRLSIVDLTLTGSQPMFTHTGRYVIIYNGELYNTDELKKSLTSRNISFRGHSDTEILIESIEAYGIEDVLKRLNGMFSFAAYDTFTKTLFLARDQIGIKPLFWSYENDVLLFGSELKPIVYSPFWKGEINFEALNNFFHLNYIPSPQSIYKNVQKLQPGHYITFKEGEEPRITKYWSTPDANTSHSFLASKENYIEYFESILSDAVRRQMISDVPIGVFLSGGIDSSLVASLMQENSATPIKTFTIGFEEDTFNESNFAQEVANHIGSEHYQEILSIKRAQDIISKLPDFYDEPFADASQLPSMLLCEHARKQVTVCLSGDGGDELFLGYDRYFYGDHLFKFLDKAKYVPFIRSLLSICSSAKLLNKLPLPDNFDLKLRKMAYMLERQDVASRYQELISLWPHRTSPLLDKNLPKFSFTEHGETSENNNIGFMRQTDINKYLPDDILQKMDRASMAYSLEARVPLLDIQVVQSALQIPNQWHIDDGKGKYILRSILKKRFPPHLFDRPKHGFSVPIADWLRGDMRDLVESYLNPKALDECGYLDTAIINERWKQHMEGTHNWQQSLWGVLMFQMWRERYKA